MIKFTRWSVYVDRENKHVLLRLLEPKSNARLLEIGPGGDNLAIRAGRIIGTNDLWGLEYPGWGGPAEAAGLAMRYCDLQSDEWPFKDDSLDVIISNQVVEHMANTDHFFREIARVLKPSGYAMISTPNLASWHNILQLMLTFQPVFCWVSDEWPGLGNPLSSLRGKKRTHPTHGHLRLFCTRALKEMCEVYGLKVEKIHGGSFGVPLVGRFLAQMMPWYAVYASVKARKVV